MSREQSDKTTRSCNGPVDRRQFIQQIGIGATALPQALSQAASIAGPFDQNDTTDHLIPRDKKLTAPWLKSLTDKGSRTWYGGDDLKTIGMPIGGICAGQVYLTGDGHLAYWDIFNQNHNTGYGQINYKVGREPTEVPKGSGFITSPAVDQGMVIRVESGGQTFVRALSQKQFPSVRFCGEYPIGYVQYADDSFPVQVNLEAFSPFIPLNTKDSALPATVLNYRVKNRSSDPVDVTLAGWLQNAICYHSGGRFTGRAVRTNRVIESENLTLVASSIRSIESSAARRPRPPIVFADFEGENYGEWKVEGKAFGASPARGTLPNQQRVGGFVGQGLVNTYLDGDSPHGRLVSPPFTIDRPWIGFLVGGGSQQGKTCLNLIVDDQIVRTATGEANEGLKPHNWDVQSLKGKQARFEIVDSASGAWGHINIDQIEFRDEPLEVGVRELRLQSDFGTMALAVLGNVERLASVSVPNDMAPDQIVSDRELASDGQSEKSIDQALRGAVGGRVHLDAGEERSITFVVSWCMPHMRRDEQLVGNHYGADFSDATAVAKYVAANLNRLAGDTRLWHDTYYDSTLPCWLLDRLHSTVANLATATCQWWRNGRFWAWEGCGCCHGTCGHVWNYAHAVARLFPELERSAREMQDFAPGVGFNPETGAIAFRGQGWGMWAGDAQAGYVLKAYREHLVSTSNDFLHRNWGAIRAATRFLLQQDGDDDGIIEGKQHQTYDQDYYGANTFVGSLYLAALRAAEEMARTVGDPEFAQRCQVVFQSGSLRSVDKLFNGEYFEQHVDLEKYPDWQYADGCLADQMFGQGWAHQLGLGAIYAPQAVAQTLRSIWTYCWAPDVGPQNQQHKPARWYAYPGEAGLFTCTWPRSKHLGPKSTRYRNEIWTGIEYQVAGHMAWDGMLTEALAICQAIHQRYHPAKHNPWNEVECGDHYARAMASWGVLIGLSGFEYDGPAASIGFNPRMTPDNFRSVFTAAEGWGAYQQRREGTQQSSTIEGKWGFVRLRQIKLGTVDGRSVGSVTVNGTATASYRQNGGEVAIELQPEVVLGAGENIDIRLTYDA